MSYLTVVLCIMKSKIKLLCLFAGFTATILGQNTLPDSLFSLFTSQLSIFPQEKIFVHTDKPYYISGEQIWFRAHLVDALSHLPSPVSRYVYIELIDPLDSVVVRVKIRPEEGSYHGHLPIPEDAPEGDYTLRAYTTFMQSLEENFFFTKNIRINDPQSSYYHTDTQFSFESDNRLNATFRFTHAGSDVPVIPQSFKVSVNKGRQMDVNTSEDGKASIIFNFPTTSRKRIMLLETEFSQNPYRQFVTIPVPDNDFDVSFYPEGGDLMLGTACNITFKAMKSNGQSTNITGVVYDKSGQAIQKIESDYLGMGTFSLTAEKDNAYYAICENDRGQSKQFDLPKAVNQGFALSVNQTRDRIFVSVNQPIQAVKNDELYLFAHTRGIVHFAMLWDNEKNQVVIAKEQFPSGVLNFILFDAGLNPVSERLVFVNNQDQAEVTYQPDRKNFDVRSLVRNRIMITDNEGEPLIGNFSVSVTSNMEVLPDSTSNILTYLLLTSDLCGHIENPTFYFKDRRSSAYALDLLMRTQGWRRYNLADVAKGRFSLPKMPIEIGAEISGTVKSVLTGIPAANVEVTAISNDGNYVNFTNTDEDGRFSLYGCELPDSTEFVVSAVQKIRMTRMNLFLDDETFPEKTLLSVPPAEIENSILSKYAEKAEQKYTEEHGIHMIELSEVTVTANRKPPERSQFYSYDFLPPSSTKTWEDIKETNITNMSFLLDFFHMKGLIYIDDVYMGATFDINSLPVEAIAQIDMIKPPLSAIYGFNAAGANVLSIYTKRGGEDDRREIPSFHIKTYFPLGYQQPVEFYAPKYDTPEKRDAPISDLRTTIHWQPVVETDSLGVASFEFYTADEPTSYTVIIEGLANDGSIIRKEGKLW